MLKLFSNEKKWDLSFSMILIITVVITRIPFISRYLYEWDSVNYALALTNYNLLQQQPHPPGYIFYVALGRGLNYIIHDPNTTLITLAIIISGASAVLIYFLTKEIFSKKIGIIASILFIFNPLIWFYGEIASIYAFEAFFSILIAYTSYRVFRGNENALYLSAILLGIAGGFRIDIVEFMFPLWIFCIIYSNPEHKKIIKTMTVFVLAVLSWLVPTVLSVGGFSQYMQLLKTTSAAASHTSILFGSTIHQQITNIGIGLIWSLIGLSLVGVLAVTYFIVHYRGELKTKIILNLKKPLNLFFLIWIGPAFIFYVLIYVVKPGYLLTCLPAFIIILSYIFNKIARIINAKYPKISIKMVLTSITALYIILNTAYFIYPADLHNDETWETPMAHMNMSQTFWFDLDVGFMYNNAKILANDENTQLSIQNMLNISNSSPSNTIIVIRDITHEDEGFDWRKAMYYLPEYNVYYFLDQENSGLTNQVSMWHGKNHSYYTSESTSLYVPMNSSTTKIIWIMNNQTSFYQEVKNELGVNQMTLSNGLNIYYSDVGNQTSDFQIGNFIFQVK